MEKRKIVYNEEGYQVLKPKNNGWYSIGERKSIHGLDELLNKAEFDFEIPWEIQERISEYRKYREEKRKRYSL